MKYILILLVTSCSIFGQVFLPIEMNNDIPITQCFKIVWEFEEGWEDMVIDSTCTETIDVRIKRGGKTIDYTAEEFLKRLGFIE